MTEREISISCNEARKVASSLRTESDTCRNLAQQYGSRISELSQGWRGRNASKMIARLEGRRGELIKAANRLSELAEAIAKTADIYERTETAKVRAAKAAQAAANAAALLGGGGGGSSW